MRIRAYPDPKHCTKAYFYYDCIRLAYKNSTPRSMTQSRFSNLKLEYLRKNVIMCQAVLDC